MHSEKITQNDKKLVYDLDYDGVGFPVQEKDFGKFEILELMCFIMRTS